MEAKLTQENEKLSENDDFHLFHVTAAPTLKKSAGIELKAFWLQSNNADQCTVE